MGGEDQELRVVALPAGGPPPAAVTPAQVAGPPHRGGGGQMLDDPLLQLRVVRPHGQLRRRAATRTCR